MKQKYKKLFIGGAFCLIIVVTLISIYYSKENVATRSFTEKLKEATEQHSTIKIADLTSFQWSAVCIIGSYHYVKALEKEYSFLRDINSTKTPFKLDMDLNKNRLVALLFYNKLNDEYVPIKLTDNFRYGMAWYFTSGYVENREKMFSAPLPKSEQIQKSCLQFEDIPTIRFLLPIEVAQADNEPSEMVLIKGK